MSALFLAAGQDGLRLTSQDGVEWKNEALGKEGEIYRAAAFGNGRFVAVGSYGGENIIASSADGVAWKTAKKEAKYVKYLRGLAFGGGQFVGIGGDPGSVGAAKPFVCFSRDGEKWGDFIDIAGKFILRRIVFGNGLWVGVGDRGRRAYSRDAKTWDDVPNVKPIDTLIDIAFGVPGGAGGGVFVGVGLHGLRVTTKDGAAWSEPVRGQEGEHINSIVWAGDRFVGVGAGATYISPDGEKWERRPNQDAPLACAFGGGAFVGANWKGRILTSTDGIAWKQVFKSEHHVEALAFGQVK
jgi:hypothetical protein